MKPKYFHQYRIAVSVLAIVSTCVAANDSPFNPAPPNYNTAAPGQQLALLDTQPLPDHLTLQENKAIIGEVIIKRGNVFDPSNPEEDIALFRLANQLHIVTQESVIRNLLLFKSGDYFSQRLLEESERLLRHQRYLFDAEIRPVSYHDNIVDIEVVTRDVWTLTGSINFSREGGSNALSAEIQESNLLGYGKDLKLLVGSDVDRKESLIAYEDRQLFNTHNQLSLLYNAKSDGLTKAFEIVRPFYSLQSKWSLGFSALSDDRFNPVYQNGEEVSQFEHSAQQMKVFWGLSEGYVNNLVYRWRFGYSRESDRFSTIDDYPLAELPEDRDYRYPWIALEIYEDRVIKATNITQIQRTEDLNLGNEVNASLGWSDRQFGAENEGLIFEFDTNMAFKPKPEQLLLFNPFFDGRYSDYSFENTHLGFDSKYFIPNFGSQVFYASLRSEYVKNPYLGQELLLGGDSGLRGYPLRYQTGDRMFLLTLEQRLYTHWHWFQLAYVGALVFYDIGRAWTDDEIKTDSTGILRDAGIGLRLASSRSSRGIILHIDLAFPMDGGSDIDDVQLVITTKENF